MSYLDTLESLAKVNLNELSADDFHPNNIISTMRNMYVKGAEDMDKRWREAILLTYCDENTKSKSNILLSILNILNKND